MTMYWIYDLPNWLFGVLTLTFFNVVGIAGLFATRPLVGRLVKRSGVHNDLVSWFFAAVAVFYGLAIGLIAVATWEAFTSVDALVSNEAAALAGLYRDLDGYPPDSRANFEGQLRRYTEQIVRVEWPEHRQGRAPAEGTETLDALENDIMAFEPKNERERIAHAEVLHGLDNVVKQRQERMQAVFTGLPATLWAVVLIGALVNFVVVYLFWVQNEALHIALVSAFASLVALLIFLTAAMDNPFRGEFSVAPDAIQVVLDSVMKPANGGK